MVSVFEIFKPGLGPSSSHTMGPMTAAYRFACALQAGGGFCDVERVTVTLYGSLALTGRGHGTDRGVILGLMGFTPATADPDLAATMIATARRDSKIDLAGARAIGFSAADDILWAPGRSLPQHPNALAFRALKANGEVALERLYFSVGGGFVRDEAEMAQNAAPAGLENEPYPFESAAELLEMADAAGLTIADVMMANEVVTRPKKVVEAQLDQIAELMNQCIDRGIRQSGELPGGLKVRRRAKQLLAAIVDKGERNIVDPLAAMDWVNLWALAVNEENAAGGRIVTAPTNGVSVLITALMLFYYCLYAGSGEGRRRFLLTAAAIGALYKRNASISGAEVGCQGEVGVACSMAAGALCAVLGGSNAQVENAAEIGMEHNLGLTCDPIAGLVQIPCIERNAMGAVKAIDAARLALLGDGQHSVSLDKVIATMKRTGADMLDIYKETSLGGLAIDIPVSRVEC